MSYYNVTCGDEIITMLLALNYKKDAIHFVVWRTSSLGSAIARERAVPANRPAGLAAPTVRAGRLAGRAPPAFQARCGDGQAHLRRRKDDPR